MELRVERHIFSKHSTIGKLFVNGEFLCFTLEPVWRTDDVKPRAIPEGTYSLVNRLSPKRNRNVPHVERVPGFEDIEIHWGNGPHDTEGCLLVGKIIGPEKDDWISQSQVAWYDLMEILKPAWDKGEAVSITYVNQRRANEPIAA